MMGWQCQEGHFYVEIVTGVGWHLDPIKKLRGHCVLCNCNCNRCFGWRRVGRVNAMGDNMFVLDIKFYEIVVLGIVFGAILCDGRLWFQILSSPRHVSMVSWTWDNMSEDLFFMTTSRQYRCQRLTCIGVAVDACMNLWDTLLSQVMTPWVITWSYRCPLVDFNSRMINSF